MSGATYPRPIWRVTLEDKDMTSKLEPRLVDLSITESRGGEADQLNIVLTDHDGKLEVPARGVVLRVFLGWEASGLVDKGTFQIDEVAYDGPPDKITLRGRSADMTSSLRTRTERSFHDTTIEEIVSTIATSHQLTPVIGNGFANVKVAHIDQTNESDLNFLNRLGKRYDAVATMKDGKLLFMPIAPGCTASGQEMPTFLLSREDGDGFRFNVSERESYTEVRAYWQDKGQGKRRSVAAGVAGNTKCMREIFASEADALENVNAEWQRIQRGKVSLQFDLAYGRPDLSPQVKVQFPEMKAPMGSIIWLLSRVTHKLSSGGLGLKL